MDIQKVFQHNQEWINKKLSTNENYFKNLAKGQSPHTLYIGCSDSRVTAEELLGVEPGEVFVHRNIANMVNNSDLNVLAIIDYAVKYLKIDHIILCGHYNCEGVKSAMQPKDLGILNPWLRNIRDVYRIHKTELNQIEDIQKRYNRLVELNVEEQCINLLKTAAVQKAVIQRNLQVHGWIFDISTGKLIDLEINLKSKLKDIMEIYNLNGTEET